MDNNSQNQDYVYNRKNGESIFNDIEAIESCKREQSRDVIDNARLGSIDKYGNYIIIPDIKRELISLPKLVYNTIIQNGTTIYELKSNIPIFGDTFFKLTIGKDKASLALIESVSREAGGYREMYEEVFDSYDLGEDRLPTSYLFRIYNISEKPSENGKDDYLKCDNILMRKVYLNLLSKELQGVSKVEEKKSFDQMVTILKKGGEYGRRVLTKFIDRLKDRPAVFEIVDTDGYQKAMNEVLLSSLDIATTNEDKQNKENHRVYLDVLNARNANIENEIRQANSRIDENYVKAIVKKATDKYTSDQENQKASISEYFAKLEKNKKASQIKKRTLEKPILKQGKTSTKLKGLTKEEKVKALLNKNKKKTPANKKLKAAKGKTANKKLKAKQKKKTASKKKSSAKKKRVVKKPKLKNKKKKVKKPKKALNKKKKKFAKSKKGAKKLRKPKKGKLKNKKKKFKKAINLQKAKGKGGEFKPKPAGAANKKKKQEQKKNITIRMALAAAFKNKGPAIKIDYKQPTTAPSIKQGLANKENNKQQGQNSEARGVKQEDTSLNAKDKEGVQDNNSRGIPLNPAGKGQGAQGSNPAEVNYNPADNGAKPEGAGLDKDGQGQGIQGNDFGGNKSKWSRARHTRL